MKGQTTVGFLGLLLAVALLAGVGTAPVAGETSTQSLNDTEITIVLEPAEAEAPSGEERVYDIVVSGATAGISSYSLSVPVDEPETASIVGWNETAYYLGDQFGSSPLSNSNVTDNGTVVTPPDYTPDGSPFETGGDTLLLEAALLDNQWDPAAEIVVGKVVLRAGDELGETELTVGQTELLGSNATTYETVDRRGATFTVSATEPPTPALSNLTVAGQAGNATVTAGTAGSIAADVRNVGDSPGAFDVAIAVNGTSHGTATTDELESGETERVEFGSVLDSLDPGTHAVTLSTDEEAVTTTLVVTENGTGETGTTADEGTEGQQSGDGNGAGFGVAAAALGVLVVGTLVHRRYEA